MDKNIRFKNYGLEDVVVETAPVVVEDAVQIDESVPDAVIEVQVQVADQEANVIAGDIAEMSDVQESLEAIADGIAQTLKHGGLNVQAACFALQSADLQLNRLGMAPSLVSVESFEEVATPAEQAAVVEVIEAPVSGDAAPADAKLDTENKTSAEPDASSVVKSEEAGVAGTDNADAPAPEVVKPAESGAVVASQEAIADIKARVAAIWESIKNAIKKFYEKVLELYNKIADFTVRQGRVAAEYGKKIQGLASDEVKKQKIKFKVSRVVGKEDLGKIKALVVSAATFGEGAVESTEAEIKKAIALITDADEAKQAEGKTLVDELIARWDALEAEAGGAVDVPGVGKVTVSKSGKVEIASEEADGDVDGEVEAESKSALVSLSKEIVVVANDTKVQALKKKVDAALARIAAAIDAGVKKVTALGDKASAEAKSAITALGNFYSKITKSVANLFRQAGSIVGKSVKNANEYLAAQYKNFVGSKEAEAEDAPKQIEAA